MKCLIVIEVILLGLTMAIAFKFITSPIVIAIVVGLNAIIVIAILRKTSKKNKSLTDST